MERRRKIDESLKERHSILNLLKRVESEEVTFDEMDRIGHELQLGGKRALTPLVRLLWRETDSELLAKYAYLLDFFEKEPWLDQLMQVVLRRTDLDKEAKSALLGALEEYGVDITSPPFVRLMDEVGGPLSETLPRLLDQGEDGLILFMEDFLQSPWEIQKSLIQDLVQVPDARMPALLEILIGLDSQDLVGEVVTALGKIRSPEAAGILARCADSATGTIRELCQRSLRRLAFVGIMPPPASEKRTDTAFHVAWASPLDGAGYRTLWFSRWCGERVLSFICLHIHEITGIRAAWGSGAISEQEFIELTAERVAEEGLVQIAFPYAFQLLCDALFRNRDTLFQLPPEYYVLKHIFSGEELEPVPYLPDFSGFDLNALARSTRLFMSGAALYEDDYYAGWYMATCRIYDLAEEWVRLQDAGDAKALARGLEGILERFCRELIAPQVEQIRNRLLLTADLLMRSGRERDLVEVTLATALSLNTFSMPYHLHPFLRQLALESLDAAREAMAEGYDLREHPHEADDDEWLD